MTTTLLGLLPSFTNEIFFSIISRGLYVSSYGGFKIALVRFTFSSFILKEDLDINVFSAENVEL